MLQPVVQIHVSNRILSGMVIWVAFMIKVLGFFIILDLEAGGQTLRTEGDFIPSVTTGDDPGYQIKLVSPDGIAHHIR